MTIRSAVKVGVYTPGGHRGRGGAPGAWRCLLAGALVAACANRPAEPTTPERRAVAERDAGEHHAVGGDRDAHGCIGSAGYSWCARENECVHPWETARSHGIEFGTDSEANRQAIERYCNAAAQGAPTPGPGAR